MPHGRAKIGAITFLCTGAMVMRPRLRSSIFKGFRDSRCWSSFSCRPRTAVTAGNEVRGAALGIGKARPNKLAARRMMGSGFRGLRTGLHHIGDTTPTHRNQARECEGFVARRMTRRSDSHGRQYLPGGLRGRLRASAMGSCCAKAGPGKRQSLRKSRQNVANIGEIGGDTGCV